MKLNDVRVLRNILGDKLDNDDHDEFLERKIPTMTMKKLDLKKMPKRDMYGRNLEVPTGATKEVMMEAIKGEKTAQEIKDGIEIKKEVVDNRSENDKKLKELQKARTIRQLEIEQKLASQDPEYEKRLLAREREKEEIKSANALQYYKTIQNITRPRPREPGMMPVTVMGEQVKIPLGPNKKVGIPLSIPTRTGVERFYKGFQKTVAPWTDRLSYSAGGAIVGEFGDEQSSKVLQRSIAERQNYIQYLSQKYSKKGFMIRNENDLLNVATDKEKAKIQNLSLGVQSRQRSAASMGFMSGTSGQAIISGTRSRSTSMNILPMTTMGRTQVTPGMSSQESMARLGITQNLSKLTPENKWGVIFNETPGNTADKLTRIIGKAPQPGMQRPEDKLDKYMNKFNTGNFNNKVKKLI